MPLVHSPGHAQADFGEAWAVIGGVKQKVHFFAFDLPHSDASYVRAYPAARAEAWVDGHVRAFSFFGAVPVSIVYDNDRCLVSRIERGGTRRRTRLFSGFLSHYLIRDRYPRHLAIARRSLEVVSVEPHPEGRRRAGGASPSDQARPRRRRPSLRTRNAA